METTPWNDYRRKSSRAPVVARQNVGHDYMIPNGKRGDVFCRRGEYEVRESQRGPLQSVVSPLVFREFYER